MKQGYLARLKESLGEIKRGEKKQSLKARADESEAMEKSKGKKAFSAVKTMDKTKKKTMMKKDCKY